MQDLHHRDLLRQAKSHVLREYGPRGYGFWKNFIVDEPIFLCHPNDSGIEIEISSFWDTVPPRGVIRVMVSILEMEPKHCSSRVPTSSFLVFEDEHIDPLDEGDGRREKEEKETT